MLNDKRIFFFEHLFIKFIVANGFYDSLWMLEYNDDEDDDDNDDEFLSLFFLNKLKFNPILEC